MRQGAFSRQPAFDQTGRGGSLQYTAITAAAGNIRAQAALLCGFMPHLPRQGGLVAHSWQINLGLPFTAPLGQIVRKRQVGEHLGNFAQ